MPSRIAVGGILTECNHLGGVPITVASFERYELLRGEQLLDACTGVVEGMVSTLRRQGAEVVPLLFASTCPGGPLTAECYRTLKQELLGRLQDVLPIDGLLLPLHGAMTVADVDDPEGDLAHEARVLLGTELPIGMTLDLHAHVTPEMVQSCDFIMGWETYPHRDAVTTGKRGAELMAAMVAGECRPTMAMAKVPVITSGVNGSTEGNGPFAELMRMTKSLEQRKGVLSTSLFLTHPYLDLPAMGSGGLVITDDDPTLAATLATEIAHSYWDRRHALEPEVWTPHEAVRQGLAVEGGPVVLVEAADCCGGGAAGDSVATLRVLAEQAINETSLVPVVDAAAAAAAHRLGVGGQLQVALGHQHDSRWGDPLTIAAEVERLSDGQFTYQGGIFDGVVGQMGPAAVLAVGGLRILVATHATYDWRDEQFRSVGLDPAVAKFVVAKNPMNYRLAYGPLAKAIYLLDSPGPTPVTLKHVPFRRLERPYFPADDEIPDLQPMLLTSGAP